MLELLQGSPGERLDAAAAAIQAALRHVDVAEALHLQDEDQSLLPRLAEPPLLHLDHAWLTHLWQDLRPVLVSLQAELDAGRPPPAADVQALARLLPRYVEAQRRHHAHEEAAIWPLAEALGPEAKDEIAAEMKARRADLTR